MGDEPTNDSAASRPPEGPRPSWSTPGESSAGPAPGSPPPFAPDGTPPYADTGSSPPPPPPPSGAGRIPADHDLWGEPGDARPPASRAKPLAKSTKAWVGAGVGALAIVGAAVFGINAAGSTPSNNQAGPTVYGLPTSFGQEHGYGLPGAGPRDGYGSRTERMGIIGTIASLGDSSFTVKDPKGGDPITVKVTADTKITKVGSNGAEQTIKLSDLKVGDRVMAEGTPNGNTVTADVVRVGDLRDGMSKRAGGGCGPGMGKGGRTYGKPDDNQQPPSAPGSGGSETPNQGSTESTSTGSGTV